MNRCCSRGETRRWGWGGEDARAHIYEGKRHGGMNTACFEGLRKISSTGKMKKVQERPSHI